MYIDEIVSGNMIRTRAKHMIGEPPNGKKRPKHGILSSLIEKGEAELYVVGVTHGGGSKMKRQFRHDFEKWENWGSQDST